MTTAQSLPYAALESQLAQIEFWQSPIAVEYAEAVRGNIVVKGQGDVQIRSAGTMAEGIRNAFRYATPYFLSSEIITLIHDSMKDFPTGIPFGSIWPENPIGWMHMEQPFMLEADDGGDGLECAGILWSPEQQVGHMATGFFGGSVGWPYANALRLWTTQTFGPDAHIGDVEDLDVINLSNFGIYTSRFTATLFAFLRQKIVSFQDYRGPRSTTRRFQRATQTEAPLVRVIQLRKREVHGRENGDSEPQDWSYRWIVSGHWRKQWYSSRQRHEPLFIDSYVKGPDDKPLKARRVNLYAVVN